MNTIETVKMLTDAYDVVFTGLGYYLESGFINDKSDLENALNETVLNVLEKINSSMFNGFNDRKHAVNYLRQGMKNQYLDLSKRQSNIDYLSFETIESDFSDKLITTFKTDLFRYVLTYKSLTQADIKRIKKDSQKVQAIALDKKSKSIKTIDRRKNIKKDILLKKPYFLSKEQRLLCILYYQKGFTYEEIGKVIGMEKSGIQKKILKLNNRINLIPIQDDKNVDLICYTSKDGNLVWPYTDVVTPISFLRSYRSNQDVATLEKYRQASNQAMRKHASYRANIVPQTIDKRDVKVKNGMSDKQTISAQGLKNIYGFNGYRKYNPCLEKTLTPIGKLETDYLDYSLWFPVKCFKRILVNTIGEQSKDFKKPDKQEKIEINPVLIKSKKKWMIYQHVNGQCG